MEIEWAKGVTSGGGGYECEAAGEWEGKKAGLWWGADEGSGCGEAEAERGASARRAVG